ncbi:carbohydrate ABC transporter permease [Candidatus Clostridium radicumherbarum]|uniref:Carbohydrate ABC transporter permease n=1 Tax=Candidatus Clostridium radicumherbarum TaxID=3381662 RepID=A0ABW8TSE8_9CLOT
MAIKRSKGERFSDVIIHLIMIAYSICCLYPILLTFMTSISSEKSVANNGFQLIPQAYSLQSYKIIMKDKSIFQAYGVTIFVTVVGTILALFLCGMAGYAMSVQKVKYRNKVAMFFYIPMVFSAGIAPWYLVCTQVLHFHNNIWALIMPGLVSPFNIFLMRNYFKTIPASLIESAEIDGCSNIRIFIKIILPLSKPIIATVCLFVAMGYWNDWTNALWFIDNRNLYPLQYYLFRIKDMMDMIRRTGSGGMQLPTQTFQLATLFVTIGPIVFLYPFVQKYFIKGIMIGSVKG